MGKGWGPDAPRRWGVLQEAYDDLHTYISEQEEMRGREYKTGWPRRSRARA